MEVPNNQARVANPMLSLDGRYLIYTEKTSPSDVTLLENF